MKLTLLLNLINISIINSGPENKDICYEIEFYQESKKIEDKYKLEIIEIETYYNEKILMEEKNIEEITSEKISNLVEEKNEKIKNLLNKKELVLENLSNLLIFTTMKKDTKSEIENYILNKIFK